MRREYLTRENARRANEHARIECIAGKAKFRIAFEKPVEIEIDARKPGITRIVDGRSGNDKVVRELLQLAKHRATHHGVGIDNQEAFASAAKEQLDFGETEPASVVREDDG